MQKLLVPFALPAAGMALFTAWTIGGAPASALAQHSPPRQCFLAANVNGFTPRGHDQVDVQVGVSRYYRLTLIGACPEVDWSLRVALRTTGGSSWICHGADAEIIVPAPGGPQRCLVSDIRQLTPAEIEANRHRHH